MNGKLIIALDQGSSSSRALAIDEKGRIVARASRALDTLRAATPPETTPLGRNPAGGSFANGSAEGLAEFDAWELVKGQVEALFEVLRQVTPEAVSCIAVASQRSTVVFWDRLTGKPVAPALSWQDGRAAAESEAAPLTQEAVHALTGLYKTPFYSAAKIAWTLKNAPQAAQAAADGRLCAGPVASYIIWHLTRGQVFACDPTLAQRTLLFNISTLNWEPQLLDAFGVERAWLPQIKLTSDDYGVFEHAGMHIPVRVCVGDQQAALQALRVVSGGACINYGTGAFFMRNTGNQCHLLPGLLTSVGAAQYGAACEYLLEGPVNACGTVFAWLNEIGFSFGMDELDILCEASRAPVQFLPALGGLGAPYWDFVSTPVFAGLSPHTKKADVVRGAVDGIALLLADIVFYAERYGIKSGEIKVAGGLSKSRCLLRAQADVLQTRLLPCAEAESTAVGAALLAAPAAGIDAGQWETMRLLPAVQPQMDAEEAEAKYMQWHAFLNWCKLRK